LASLREHYLKAAVCLVEDGIEDFGLLDIYAEALSLWLKTYSKPIPETLEDFFDRELENLSFYRLEALHRFIYAGLEGPGAHIDTVVAADGSFQTRVRVVTYQDDRILINEQIHSGLNFQISIGSSGAFKLVPVPA